MKNIYRRLWDSGLRIFLILPAQLREKILMVFVFIFHYSNIRKNVSEKKRVLENQKKEDLNLYLNSKDVLNHFCLTMTNSDLYRRFLQVYQNKGVRCLQRKTGNNIPHDQVILVGVVKNDLPKIRMQIAHHRSLGIQNFVYIDNMSSDGTFEWLRNQNVDLYQVDEPFSALIKIAWIRQITDVYGYNRWYLILDSDELLVYPGMEYGDIKDLIHFAEKEDMNFIQSFLIDVYSKGKIFGESRESINIDADSLKKQNCYFDTDSYFFRPSYKGLRIVGGPRTRIFSSKKEPFTPLLTKNTFACLRKEDMLGVHYLKPYYRNFNHPIISGLLHYKFLPNDYQKYRQIVCNGNYAGGSREYKRYCQVLEKKPDLYFYYEKSQKWERSLDLLKINIMNQKYCRKFISQFLSKTTWDQEGKINSRK